MADVFISFIHEEEAVATAIQRFIRDVLPSTEVFLSADTWQIYAGEIWLDRIFEELKKSKIVLLLLSPKSVGRPWVNFEAGGAWFSDKKLIPMCFHGLTKDKLPKPYSNIQAVDLTTRDDQYYLVKSVAHYLTRLAPPPPWPDGVLELLETPQPALTKGAEPYKNLSEWLKRFDAENETASNK